ncbi:hypothetical protein F183_A39220 [Bryobacterales bacterium F-183]|nr:hypothetical protein F183_A39220 [Bryobacterales bacterium F-183]
MTSTRLKFEIIDAATARRAGQAPKMVTPPDPQSMRELAAGLDFVLSELMAAESLRDEIAQERDAATAERSALATQRDILLEQRSQMEVQRTELEAQRDELAAKQEQVQAQIEQIQQQLSTVEAKHAEAERQIAEMAEKNSQEQAEREAERAAFQATLETERANFESHLETERADFMSRLAQVSLTHEAAVTALRDGFDAQCQILSTTHQEELERQKNASEQAIAEVRRQTEELRAEANESQVSYQKLSDALTAAEAQTAELVEARRVLETVLAEQQRALVLSMELMTRLEGEVKNLRNRVDTLTAEVIAESHSVPPEAAAQIAELQVAKRQAEAAVADLQTGAEVLETRAHQLETMILELSTTHATELAKREAEVQKRAAEAAALQTQLEDAQRSIQLIPPPEAAIRSLEDQRDQARRELATYKSDLEILTADVKTKEGLITTLEAALDQQQNILRSLEQRFNEYASRLHGICDISNEGDEYRNESEEGRVKRLVTWFQSAFSPARIAAPAADSSEPGSPEQEKGLNDDTTEQLSSAAGVGHGNVGRHTAGIQG